jgi:hypothetical protein
VKRKKEKINSEEEKRAQKPPPGDSTRNACQKNRNKEILRKGSNDIRLVQLVSAVR